MMSLKSLFFEDEEPVVAPSQPTATIVPNVSQTPPITTGVQPQVKSADSTAHDKFMAHFDDLFKNSNLPGPDYYEFSKMIESMASLSDEIRVPAAFSALSVQGLTKDMLISTAKQYIGFIDDDAKKFSEALDTKLLKEIEQKKASILSKKSTIKQKEELIEKMRLEIISETAEVEKFSTEVISEEIKYNDKITVYKTVCETRKNYINADINKITNLIK